jgi:hypothetical protein
MTDPDWLTALTALGNRKMAEVGFYPFVLALGLSLLVSLFIAFLYLRFYKSRATGSLVHRAFPLVGLSVTAIFICVQFSLPLSLGLLGALSIVRFRTPIKEPEEIGFILLVIAAALCCATFNLLFLVVLLLVAVLGLLLQKIAGRLFKGRLNDGMVILALPAEAHKTRGAELLALLRDRLPNGRLDSLSEQEGETVISYSFAEIPPDALPALEALRQTIPGARLNVFFNRPGEI